MNAIHLSLASYPGIGFAAAMEVAVATKPAELPYGALSLSEVQLCPQNRGTLTDELAGELFSTYPGTRFRLHANVRVFDRQHIFDSTLDIQHQDMTMEGSGTTGISGRKIITK